MYDTIQTFSDDHTDDLHLVASDPYHLLYLLEPSLPVLDYLSYTFPFDESIMDIMSTDESIWEDHHHRSMFLPNTTFPKDNFSTPHIDQIIENCAGSVIFSFMDVFSGYNHIEILPTDQHKTTFIYPWGTFAYKKLPFGLKNVEPRSSVQCPMRFMILNILLNCTLMTSLLIHSNRRTTLVILEIFS